MFTNKLVALLVFALIYFCSGVAVHCNDVGAVTLLEEELLTPNSIATSNEQDTCRACEGVAARIEKGIPFCQVTCANICKNQRNRNKYLIRVTKGAHEIVNFGVEKRYKRCKFLSKTRGVKNCVCGILLRDPLMPPAPKSRLFDKIQEICDCKGKKTKYIYQRQIRYNEIRQKKYNVHDSIVRMYKREQAKEKVKTAVKKVIKHVFTALKPKPKPKPKPQAKPKAKPKANGKGKRALEVEIETLELKAQTLESKAEELEEKAETME